jgi:large subunit ribosomal protein L24
MLDIIVCITQAVSDFPDVETMVLRIAKGYPWCYVVLVASTRLERRFADGSRAPKPKVVISPPARPTSNVKKSEQRKETHTSTAAASLHRQHIPHKPPTMQKVIQRSALAKRNADRRLQKIVEHHEKGQGWSRRNEAQRIRKFNHSLIKDARLARQEDWARGALAPRRDVGDKAETYGSVGIFNMNWAESQEKNKPTWNSIVEGDRVVVTKGREKGKIGVVDLLDDQRGFVKIKGINVGDINIPEWAQQENNSQPMVSMSMPIAIESVKLVYPLPNEATGVPQDVVIDRLERVNEQWDAVKRVWDKGERAIPGTSTLIPWPETIDSEERDHDDDTLRISVEEETFRPHLMFPPMPTSVIDELRSKYSKFRTRHDHEFVQKMEAIDAREEKRAGLIKTVRTPLQELADMRAKQKAAAERQLTDEQLAKIGEVISSERVKFMRGLRQAEA